MWLLPLFACLYRLVDESHILSNEVQVILFSWGFIWFHFPLFILCFLEYEHPVLIVTINHIYFIFMVVLSSIRINDKPHRPPNPALFFHSVVFWTMCDFLKFFYSNYRACLFTSYIHYVWFVTNGTNIVVPFKLRQIMWKREVAIDLLLVAHVHIKAQFVWLNGLNLHKCSQCLILFQLQKLTSIQISSENFLKMMAEVS